ncbi:MAG: hypothetical protein IPI66_10075 [Chitinophagaceae bacterium]|nr:hypothetical protein [Chitinophagaceae bacterium]
MIKTFGKVKVRIKTGFDYEEINKAWLIGEYTNILTDKIKYNDSIFLDFNHAYTGDCNPDYFISYDDGSIKENYSGGETYHFLKTKAVVIREVSRRFDIATTLKLVEYAISNLISVKHDQRSFEYNKNYCQWLINTIDTSITRKASLTTSSVLINQVLSKKIFRPKKEKQTCVISYFVKDNKYNVYFNSFETKKDTVVLVTDNIYQFEEISYHEVLVFINDSTFYYFEGNYRPNQSKNLVIQNSNNYYRPFEISKISPYKITISFSDYTKKGGRQPRYRTLIYRSDVTDLIQDIDELIDK